MQDIEQRLNHLQSTLKRWRIPVSTEAVAQEAIETALTQANVAFQAQKVLGPKDRLDVFSDGIAIEIKVKGGRTAIFRQLERYAEHPEVQGIILATGAAWPFQAGEIGGKPFRLVSLGMGWL